MFAKNLIVMKKLTLLLFASFALLACSRDDNEPTQDYTSFTLKWVGGNSDIFSNYKTGYFDEEGKCILLFEHEQLLEGVETKEYVMPVYAEKIYLFYDLAYPRSLRLEEGFLVQKNKKNRIIVPDKNNTRGLAVDRDDKFQYPH
jgi:hypothetical protein